MDSITESMMTGLSIGMRRLENKRMREYQQEQMGHIAKQNLLLEQQANKITEDLAAKKGFGEDISALMKPIDMNVLARDWTKLSPTYPFTGIETVRNAPQPLDWNAIAPLYAKWFPDEFAAVTAEMEKREISSQDIWGRLKERLDQQKEIADMQSEDRRAAREASVESKKTLQEQRESKLVLDDWRQKIGGSLPNETMTGTMRGVINPYTGKPFTDAAEYYKAFQKHKAEFTGEARSKPSSGKGTVKKGRSAEDWMADVLGKKKK